MGFSDPDDAAAHITNGFRSAKLSPYVCRLFKGQYRIRDQEYRVEKYYLNGHAIHGLLYDAPFTIAHSGADEEKAVVVLSYSYPGSDPGYPFPFDIQVKWELKQYQLLSVTTTIQHHGKEPIPVADGWHPYFTLGGKVDDWQLQFNSHTQLEYSADLLPTGNTHTDARFEEGCSLKGIELDNSFSLPDTGGVCRLSGNSMTLEIKPDAGYPILQLYIPPERESIAIENLSGAPDNFNNGIGLIWLQPGEERSFGTSYRAAYEG
jgi:aldose 1-epimerase